MGRRTSKPKPRAREIAPPDGLRAARFALHGRDVAVLSYPTDDIVLPDALSPAEKEVTRALLHGAPNAEIARQRGVAARTIANQIASVFKKLGVSGRAELAALLRAAGSPRARKKARKKKPA